MAVVKDKVQTYLRELVGSYEVDSDGDYTFRDGSARIFVSVREMVEHAYVEIYSILTVDIPETPEIYEYVATKSGSYYFGGLGVRKQPENGVRVILSHGLMGDYLDPEELKLAVVLLARTADELDTEIRERFGGTTFHDDV
jgi:hypothetical protein